MAEHRIFPHGMPEQLAPNLWQVRGSMALPLRRNMTVYRLDDGRLVLYSVVAMNEEGMKALEALGRPAIMVVPHGSHAMDVTFYRARYPDLKLACPSEGKQQVEKQRRTKVDGTPEELLGPVGIKVHPVGGIKNGEFAMEVDIPGGKALVINDVLGGPTPGEKVPFVLRLTGPPGGQFGVARIVRLVMVKNKIALRSWLHLMAENGDIKVVTVSHGPPVTGDCAQALRDAAATV
jgi:hypothetical protein